MIRSFFLLALLTLTRLSFAQQVYYLTVKLLELCLNQIFLKELLLKKDMNPIIQVADL